MNTATAEQIRSTVEMRIRELAPALAELEQLQGVLAILDDPATCRQLEGVPGVSSTLDGLLPATAGEAPRSARITALRPQPPVRAIRLGSKPGSDGRAPQGANKQRILTAIATYPGIAAPEIARLTGLKRPVVASTISRLKRTGELRPHGDGVCLVGALTPASAPSNVHRLPGA